MRKIFKAFHMLGFSLFLGSIAVYIALSTQHWSPGTPAFAQLRDQIALGTRFLTLPGLLATLASGFGLLWLNRNQLQRWQIAKAIVGFLLLFNTWLIVGPAVKSAAHLSATAVFSQAKIGELGSALKIETVAGAINVSLACLEIGLAVLRPKLRWQNGVGQPSLYEAKAGTRS
jgi:small-conductance mechanosensitive channel